MKELLSTKKTMVLSTINNENVPCTSYAPFCILGDKAYIYLSKVADHYKNIMENENVSAMVIEDEAEAKQKFARKRVVFRCKGKKVDSVPKEVMDLFDLIDGKQIMDVLKTLDFDWFVLNLEKGRLVQGFGQAFDLEYKDNEWIQNHVIIDKGHEK